MKCPLTNPAISLMLINRFICNEVFDILEKSREIRNYHLDIMFVKMAGLWPTWTCVPALMQHVDTIYTTFRIFNPAQDLDAKFDGSGPLGNGDGGRRQGVWNFYHLLTAFLEYGPRAKGAGFGRACNVTIKNLILDVQAPSKDEDHEIVGPARGPRGRYSDFFGSADTFTAEKWPKYWNKPAEINQRNVPADKLAHFMMQELESLLSLNYHTMDYGLILYEGIMDSIDIRVSGETRFRFDLNAMLRNLVEKPLDQKDLGVSDLPGRRERWQVWTTCVQERRRLCKERQPVSGARPHMSVM